MGTQVRPDSRCRGRRSAESSGALWGWRADAGVETIVGRRRRGNCDAAAGGWHGPGEFDCGGAGGGCYRGRERRRARWVDAYAALNTRLGKRFAGKPSQQVLLTENQRDPQAYAAPLAKELQRSGAADSDEILTAARAVLAAAGGSAPVPGGTTLRSTHADLSVCGKLGASEVHELPMWHAGRRLPRLQLLGPCTFIVHEPATPCGILTAADPAGDHSVGRYENVLGSAATLFYDGRLCSAVTEASGKRRHPRGCAPAESAAPVSTFPAPLEAQRTAVGRHADDPSVP